MSHSEDTSLDSNQKCLSTVIEEDDTSQVGEEEPVSSPEDDYSQQVAMQPSSGPSSQAVRVQIVGTPDDSYSTLSGTYAEAQTAQPSKVPSSLKVRTETEAGQEESYSTISGIYDDPEIVAVKSGNAQVSLTVRTDTEPGPEDHYSTVSGIYNDPEPVIQPGNAPTSLTKAAASPEDCYSTISGIYEEAETVEKQPHDDQPGRTTEQERIRSPEASSDRADPQLEMPGKYTSHQHITFAVGGSGQKMLRGIAVSSGNEIFVADSYKNKVHIHNMEGAYVHHFSTLLPGHPDREMMPQDVSVDGKDNLWVMGRISLLCYRVVQYSRDGQGLFMLEPQCGMRFGGIAVDPRNNNIVLRRRDRKFEICIYRPDGSFVWKFGEGLYAQASFVAVNIDGSILMPSDNTIHAYNQTGSVLFTFGDHGSHGGGLRGICTDSSGHVIIANRRNRRVTVFTSRGLFVRHVDIGLKTVERVAVGPEGHLVITYQNDDTITVFTSY
ncbi:uncharacterized protein LOC118431490 [Branchiostoma floridae]|uniref:Uncharacterized protein LOC118431490 n=1 Tax=Branchiostoma floridae TaxID=7739 RepID=A0A9J7MEM1_BRAFL|nr:uncharacterized protein LOC118431490 [Branchiostoma floridae]